MALAQTKTHSTVEQNREQSTDRLECHPMHDTFYCSTQYSEYIYLIKFENHVIQESYMLAFLDQSNF